jgi:alpha/beta superfamily hydrolase
MRPDTKLNFMSYKQQSFFLKSDDDFLACSALVPATVTGGVLMLLPFAEERKGALPFYLSMARELAQLQIASLIFDWRGSGDSTGEFETVNPTDYLHDLQYAFDKLNALTDDAPIGALGVRLSAMLLHTLDEPRLKSMVAIAPVTGDEFMRQLLQRRMVNDMVAYGKVVESRAALKEKLVSGQAIDLDGYTFSAPFYEWATTLDGQHISQSSRTLPTLLIPGGHTGRASKSITGSNRKTQYSEMRFPPFWNTVGHVNLSRLTEITSNWIKTNLKTSQKVQNGAAAPETVNVHPDETIQLIKSCTNMELVDIRSIDSDRHSDQLIRAVFDKPPVQPRGGILFLHGWSGDRTGPHRFFVQLARRCAGMGFLTLRIDFCGRGLSDGTHESGTIASMAQDAEAALRELKTRLPAEAPIFIASICSGGKVAITLGAEHPEIKGMLLLSAESMGSLRSTDTDAAKTRQALLTYFKKLCRPETWKKIITGKVQTGMVTKALIKHETRSDAEARTEDATLLKFRTFRSPIHLVFGGSDPDASGSMAAYKAYFKKHRIPHSIHLIPHSGHSFYSLEWTREALENSLRFLLNEFPS